MPDPSELDRNHQVDASSCAKKSSGLKCIAKQVIDIIKTRPFMSYPQVASIVVQFNLKNGTMQDSDALCSQSNQLENESAWDESNLATSAKKKRAGTSIAPDDNETPARRRSRQESNLRRRIYDAWNVLKAASIIVEHDDKHFTYNPAILQDLDGQSNVFDEEAMQERLLLTAGKP